MMPFWRAVERMPGLAAVTQAWRQLAGAEYERLEPFLRPRDRLAASYPRPDASGGALWYRVVAHGPDDFVGLCDDTGERIELARQDLVVYELDRRAFCRAIALALGLEPEAAAVPNLPETHRIGAMVEGGARRPVYLALQPTVQHASELTLQAGGPFLFLAPTCDSFTPAVEATLAVRQARWVALCEALEPAALGSWRRTTAGEAAMAAMGSAAAPEQRDQHAVFRRSGQLWELTFEGRTVHLQDAKGLVYIARLLAEPGRSLHVAMLLSADAPNGQAPTLGSRGEALDPQAIDAYRERIAALQEQLAEAEEFGNLAGQEAAGLELDAVVGELARASGLGGRGRQNTDADRLRKAVSNAISRALAKVSAHHANLGRHLDASIQLGQFLTYAPPRPVAWTL